MDTNEQEIEREIWKATRGKAPFPEKANKGLGKN
jgi:hypothetical protein